MAFAIYNPKTSPTATLTLHNPEAGDLLRDEPGVVITKNRMGLVTVKTVASRPNYVTRVYDFRIRATAAALSTASPGPSIETVKGLLKAMAGIELKFVYDTDTFYGYIINPDVEIIQVKDNERYMLHLEILESQA